MSMHCFIIIVVILAIPLKQRTLHYWIHWLACSIFGIKIFWNVKKKNCIPTRVITDKLSEKRKSCFREENHPLKLLHNDFLLDRNVERKVPYLSFKCSEVKVIRFQKKYTLILKYRYLQKSVLKCNTQVLSYCQLLPISHVTLEMLPKYANIERPESSQLYASNALICFFKDKMLLSFCPPNQHLLCLLWATY